MISVSNLKKSFGDLVVLDGITETIEKGEKVVVIGPSGSGKSTFLRCLNLLEQPTSGVIEFEGRDITHAKGRELNSVRMKMGMVFQHFNLFPHLTIRRNITIAPVKNKIMTQAQADKRADELLAMVGLSDKADAYPAQLAAVKKFAARVRSDGAVYGDYPAAVVLQKMRVEPAQPEFSVR